MELFLSKEMISKLTIHDADMHSFNVNQKNNGNTEVCFEVKFDEDPEGFNVPKGDGITKIVFKNVWWITVEFFSNTTKQDNIDDFGLVVDSKKIDEYKIVGMAEHYFITFSSGSKIELIAEGILLKD